MKKTFILIMFYITKTFTFIGASSMYYLSIIVDRIISIRQQIRQQDCLGKRLLLSSKNFILKLKTTYEKFSLNLKTKYKNLILKLKTKFNFHPRRDIIPLIVLIITKIFYWFIAYTLILELLDYLNL